ncbi:hypothetical protein L249_2243 [Ophiocordyceps polyrhachis-furcata BCC 54312]|uniref:Mitochondrial escape protein 2 n=1 Tax=Ophiocordyceps polyrhachis-furcata BCC 54312 TaxID=1330021 RepID=A0A367LS24_9HYPO|nr:hypothetical protein L249_2243 [Ophiocordyceps polyrhachis-furcata BCC 54312]
MIPLRRGGVLAALSSPARPRLAVAWRRRCLGLKRRSSSMQDEEKESGHFQVKPNESLLTLPLKLNAVLRLPSDSDLDTGRRFESSSFGLLDPFQLVKRAVSDDTQLKVTEVMPRLKDGGAFVKVQHDASLSPSDIEDRLLRKLDENPLKPWFSPFRGIKARLVRGSPWLEDLYRFPSPLLKVEFVPPRPGAEAAELAEETLYSLFRRYGKMADILPQAWDSKQTPRYAQIGFPRVRDAIMARNCLHRFVVAEAMGGGKDGTMLRISYIKRVKARSIWEWLTSHPRILIPAVAALIAGFSVIVFDPIRKFFVKAQIQHSLHFTESRIYKWFKSQTHNFTGNKERAGGLEAVWDHRRDLIGKLQSWLDGSSDTFVIVTGPRGSGKASLVLDQALAERENVVVVDCRPIVDAGGEAGTIGRLAGALGYRPIFSWANSISSMVDLAVQSATGVKAGFSETLEAQMVKMMRTAAAALKEVALSGRSSRDKDADLSDDAYLEAHPERRPVVVIDNYLHRGGDDKSAMVYEKLAEWAASLVQNKVAHVVFLTSDTAYTKTLARAMPDRAFRTISLDDLAHGVARSLIVSRLKGDDDDDDDDDDANGEKPDLTDLDGCIRTLGGRLTDLEFLSRRIKAGQSPRQAVDDMVGETATDVVRIFLHPRSDSSAPTNQRRKWTSQQAWHLVKSLAETPSLRYNQVLQSQAFSSPDAPSSGEEALEALAGAELITLRSERGRPRTIGAGKPLYQAAFALVARDASLRAGLDLAALAEDARAQARVMDAAERELALLAALPRQTSESAGRVSYLLSRLEASQRRTVELDGEMALLRKVFEDED